MKEIVAVLAFALVSTVSAGAEESAAGGGSSPVDCPGAPDLSILRSPRPAFYADVDRSVVEAFIQNTGSRAADAPFVVRVTVEARGSFEIVESGLAAGAGRWTRFALPGNIFVPNPIRYWIVVDAAQSVPECREDDNARAFSYY